MKIQALWKDIGVYFSCHRRIETTELAVLSYSLNNNMYVKLFEMTSHL